MRREGGVWVEGPWGWDVGRGEKGCRMHYDRDLSSVIFVMIYAPRGCMSKVPSKKGLVVDCVLQDRKRGNQIRQNKGFA